MPDVRENILVRISQIADAIAPGRSGRNNDEITGRAGLGIILHDGDESIHENDTTPRNSRGNVGVMRDRIVMSPRVTLIVGGKTEEIGSSLNVARGQVIGAIVTDAVIASYVGSNGEIRYVGCTVETEAGAQREGRMEMNFSITYPLNVSEFL